MAQYIDKDALVAELERLRKKNNESENVYDFGTENALKSILSFIDTLEVKEVDLEKECSQYFEDWTVQDDLGLTKPDGWSCIVKDLYDIAKHFFELGLKAKQG